MDPKLITIQMRARALADACLLAYWMPRDQFHQDQVDKEAQSLIEAIMERENINAD